MRTDRPSTDVEAAQDALAHAEGESVRVPANWIHKQLVTGLGITLTLICLFWVAGVPYYFGMAFYQEQFLALVLGLALALAFNPSDIRMRRFPRSTPQSALWRSRPPSGSRGGGRNCSRTSPTEPPKS
jgi:hypothetical protein